MREYITTKGFYSGDLDKYVLEKEQIKFDGLKAVFRGEEHKAPQLAAAIKVGWMIPVTSDARGKIVADADPAHAETAEQRAKRLRSERLQKINGSAGAGEFIEEHVARINQPKKVREVVAADGTALTNPEIKVKPPAPEKEPKKVRVVVNELDGAEVKKLNIASHTATEAEQPASFYDALRSGEKKSLSVTKDQYVPKAGDEDPYKTKVVVTSTNTDATDLQGLLGGEAEVIASKHPTKDWGKMTATKKQAFIKKATDTTLIKQIIDSETGVVKRKAQDRMSEIDSTYERERV